MIDTSVWVAKAEFLAQKGNHLLPQSYFFYKHMYIL